MSSARRFDHVGITVADLDTVTAFFVGLGFEVEGADVRGGRVPGHCHRHPRLPYRDRHAAAARRRYPAGAVELRPARPRPGSPAAMANELGLRNVAFEVDDLQAAVDRLAADGYGLVGGIGQYEHSWRMAYVRGPEGIIVSLAERIG